MNLILSKTAYLLLAGLSLLIIYKITDLYPPNKSSRPTLEIGQTTLIVTLADNPITRAKGLSGLESLRMNEGMLFIFDYSAKHSFWMKDMKFPIDIIWLGENWEILEFTKNVSPENFPETYAPSIPARYVLEVNAGFIEKNNLKIGEIANLKQN